MRPEALGFPPELALLAQQPLEPVRVAVVDSGVDASHPLLAGRVVASFRTVTRDDEVEIVEVPLGTNNDTYGHGTGVASIVAGVAPNARIVDIRVLEPGNQGSGAGLVAGLRHAVGLACPVVNLSLAATARFSADLQALCDRAYRQGTVVVAAQRNMPLEDYGFPAELTVCVSVDNDVLPDPLSLRYKPSETIEFVALGEQIRVAAPGGGFTVRTGTSFATPAVSGICALLLGRDPTLRPFEVKSLLRAYARH